MSAVSWYTEARKIPVPDVAVALGLKLRSGGSVHGFTCPVHGADHSDGRPSGRIVHGGSGWRCWTCDIGGDCLTLAAVVLTGGPKPPREQWGVVREFFAANGWCEAERHDGPRPVRPPRPAPVVMPAAVVEDVRLPADEVRRLWDACDSVVCEVRAHRWLRARGHRWRGPPGPGQDTPLMVARLDLARGLRARSDAPAWAGFGEGDRFRHWGEAGWSLIFPCFDAAGEMVALRARWTGTAEPEWMAGEDWQSGPADADDAATYLSGDGHIPHNAAPWVETPPPFSGKEVSPRGAGACRGSVYADPVGRWLLRLGSLATVGGQPDPKAPGLQWDGTVLVVEGGPAWLRYAADPGRVRLVDGQHVTYAVLGVWSGAWPSGDAGDAIAARLASARRVIIATDDDEAGDRYARALTVSLQKTGVVVSRANKSGGEA